MRKYLYVTVFCAGMTTLAVELSASRLLGNYFGTSNLVWASIIGLILIYLTAGYFIGGSWADRSPRPRTMYGILAWGGFSAAVIPFISRPVLYTAASAFDQLKVGALLGSFSAVLVLLIIPITLLGMISPFAIRLAITDSRQAGKISGRIYAISTLGSFLGTFLPVLLVIPLVGTTFTFLIFGGLLTLVAIIGMWLSSGVKLAMQIIWMPIILGIMAALWAKAPIKTSQGQIYEGESAYNYIEVIEREGFRYLHLNEGKGMHSIWHPTVLNYGGPWQQFLVAPFFNQAPYQPERVERIAIIGLAAGTVARQATAVFGSIPIDGYEIDPVIIEVGREYFEMNLPNLNAFAEDGRYGLVNNGELYSIIAVDAYRPPYIPAHLTTQQFFQLAAAHLTEEGVLVINVGRSPTDRTLINDLASTLQTVFPSVYVVDVPYSFNSMIYATQLPTSSSNLVENFVALSTNGSTHPLLLEAIQIAILNSQSTPPVDVVFTDDWSPIEWVTNNMVLDTVLFGDLDQIGQ